jgi:hypothetical protein
MNMHKNARLTPRGRERIVRQVESGLTWEVSEAARGRFVSGLSVIAVKDWQGCRIAHPGRINCPSRRLRRLSRRLNGCAANRQADRCAGRRLASYCQACSASARLE